MPKIPSYLASLDYRPARGDVASAGASAQAMAKFGETAVGVAASIGESLREKAATAKARVEEADATARYLDSLLESASQSVEDFKNYNPLAPYGLDSRIGQMTEEIAEGIQDPEARGRFMATARTLADVQRPIVAGEQLHRLNEQGRASLASNLQLYLKAADTARHPLELDTIFDLVDREISRKAEVGFISKEEADRFQQDFYGSFAERQVGDAIDADPQAALASLRGGEDFPALGETARARLIDVAGRAVRDQAVRQQTESVVAQRDLRTGLPAYLDSLHDGEPADEDRFGRDRLIAVLGEAEGAERWAAIERAKAAGAAMADIRWASSAEIAARRAAWQSDGALPEAAGAFDRALAQREKQLHDRPADYVLANPHIAALHEAMTRAAAEPEMPPALAGALPMSGNLAGGGPIAVGSSAATPSSAEERRAATAAYANGTLAEQERLGVPEDCRQVLPETMARDLAAQIAGGDPAESDKLLHGLTAGWGADWPRALADLARHGLPVEYRLLAGLDEPVARQGFVKLLAAQSADPVALRAKAGDEAAAVDGMMPDALTPIGVRIDPNLASTGTESNAATRSDGQVVNTKEDASLPEASAGLSSPDEQLAQVGPPAVNDNYPRHPVSTQAAYLCLSRAPTPKVAEMCRNAERASNAVINIAPTLPIGSVTVVPFPDGTAVYIPGGSGSPYLRSPAIR